MLRIPQHKVNHESIIQNIKDLLHEREKYRNTLPENPKAKDKDNVCGAAGEDR